MNVSNDSAQRSLSDDEDGVPSMRLAEGLDLREVCSNTGASFGISEDQKHIDNEVDWQENFFDDEELINSLRLGAGSGIFEEEDSVAEEESEPFIKLAKKMEDMSGDGGVMKMLVRPGIGGDIPKGSTVIFHYSAFLEYLDEPFDSSYLRNKPERNTVDDGSMIPGLNIAIKTMRKNETSRFLIKPDYAYGKLGCPPRIPGNETLLYEVYIVNVIDAAAADAYDELDEKMQSNATFKERLEAARGFHRKGNNNYKEGNFRGAKNCYRRAAWIMESSKVQNESEDKQRVSLLMKMYSNLAQVYLDLKEPAKACTQCNLAFETTGAYSDDILAKLYFRSGKAKVMLNDFKAARKDLLTAQRIKPNNASIAEELSNMFLKEQKCEAQERFMCQRMFAQKSDSTTDGSEEDKEQKDVNGNSTFNVRPEFDELVVENIQNFIANPRIKELAFPSSLLHEEVVHVATVAKSAGLSVILSQRGADSSLKIVKKFE